VTSPINAAPPGRLARQVHGARAPAANAHAMSKAAVAPVIPGPSLDVRYQRAIVAPALPPIVAAARGGSSYLVVASTFPPRRRAG
jgi:hypothetical protein